MINDVMILEFRISKNVCVLYSVSMASCDNCWLEQISSALIENCVCAQSISGPQDQDFHLSLRLLSALTIVTM